MKIESLVEGNIINSFSKTREKMEKEKMKKIDLNQYIDDLTYKILNKKIKWKEFEDKIYELNYTEKITKDERISILQEAGIKLKNKDFDTIRSKFKRIK